MTEKLLPPDSSVKTVDVEGARSGGKTTYHQNRKGVVEVENARHARALRAEGFHTAGMSFAGTDVRSFFCKHCDFESLFNPCGRCGRRLRRSE